MATSDETICVQQNVKILDPNGKSIYGAPCTGALKFTEYSSETVTDDPEVCKITPVQAYMSTNINNKTSTYEDLALKILNFLGYPAVGVTDIHRDQIYEAISTAIELYTRYAGWETQYIATDSRIYEPGVGIRLDHLFTIASMESLHDKGAHPNTFKRSIDQQELANRDIYVNKVPVAINDYYISEKDYETLKNNCREGDKELICLLRDMSEKYPNGIEELCVIPGWFYEYLVERRNYDKDAFKKSKDKIATEGGEKLNIYYEDEKFGKKRDDLFTQRTYDYDMMDYRKVLQVMDYREGSSTTMTSLFSLDAALAQQTFYSYSFSLRGFDLTTYSALRIWNKEYNRVLATKRDWKFNPYTQYLTFIPEPHEHQWFYGVFECAVQRPLIEIIKSPWVFKYALACVKEMIGNVRGKWR